MPQKLRQNITIITLGAIAIIGLPACSRVNPTSSTPTTTTVASNSDSAEIPPIKAGGSTSATDFLTILKTAYLSTVETGEIDILEPSQSESAIIAVEQGLLDIGVVSKSLKPKDGNSNLNFRPAVKDALVVATHPSVTGITNLTTEDLQDIYSGTITNWKQLGGPDAEILLLDRPEDESAKRLLREYYLGANLPNSPDAIILRKEGELIQTLQSTPYSIGAFSLAYAVSNNLPINRLSLNGVEPTPDTLTTGQYPMARTIGLLWNKNASDTTTEFINYIFSPQATTILEQSGFAPLPQPTDFK
ncbi:MAG: substrate-binding domain-containing protein [Microcoleaceae cyanobacterium]